MNIEVITSFNSSYYNNIGRACVSSWLQYWPKTMSLTCYVEDCKLESHRRINQIDFNQLGNDYLNFQSRDIHSQEKKFAKKAYCVIHAMDNSSADWIVWIDSDVVSLQTINQSILDYITPKNKLASCLGVWYYEDKNLNEGKYYVPETGIFSLNRQHQYFEQVKNTYSNHYNNYEWSGLRRRLDNDAFGSALLPYLSQVNDMCADLTKPYKTPLPHTKLGPYLKHYKAKHSKVDLDIDFDQWPTYLTVVQ